MSSLAKAIVAAAVGAVLVAGLAFGLTRNPQVLPGAIVGKPAPQFSLRGIDGRTLSSAHLDGRPVVINFWASWCTECEKEHPYLMEAHDRWGEEVQFIGVVFQDTPGNIERFLLERGEDPGESYPNLMDPESRTAIDFGVYGVPETFFVDASGTIVYKRVGGVTRQLLERQIRRIAE